MRASCPRCWPRWPPPARRCWWPRPAPARPRWSRWRWPGSTGGRTTASPGDGRVVVAEPRRVAARAAARRMADLLGEPVGDRVGFSVRGESRVGRATRVEVVTTGVLVRRLQRDPELPGIAAVMLDECHERHLDDRPRAGVRGRRARRAAARPAAAGDLGHRRGGPGRRGPAAPSGDGAAPHRSIEARRCRRCTRSTAVWVPAAGRDRPAARAAGRPAAARSRGRHGPPGARRDRRRRAGLPARRGRDRRRRRPAGGLRRGATCCRCTAGCRLPARTPRCARRRGRRRVVLATAVAESSLTVPGVRVVVDAGLARVPRIDLARGLGALVTVPVSRAAATQRAGRAGREAPGTSTGAGRRPSTSGCPPSPSRRSPPPT